MAGTMMDWLLKPLTEAEVYGWETFIDDWFFVFAIGYLLFELIRYAFLKKLSWNLLGDTIVNFLTLAMFIAITFFLLAGLYVTSYVWASQFAVFQIDVNWATILICIVLADLAYYWEHRFMHRVNFAWATHTVHHSSPFFNISVAYRFGPMDGVWPIFFHLPLVFLGFNPFVVFFAEMFVQVYQTILHTEWIKKLPKPIESVMNTPSHHRVHHGSNEKYLDSNYAGVFIIWDKLFGTFVREGEPVTYGLVKPINSINPLTVFLHGFWRVGKKFQSVKGAGNKLMAFIGPPDWTSKE